MKPDKDLDGDLAMELLEIGIAGHDHAAQEAVRLIREMIRQEIAKESANDRNVK